jgi:ribosomal protein L34E
LKDPVFGSVSRAFKAFGLDHRNNSDWYSLVARLARVLFPIRRPGRKKWTAERLYLLLAQVAAYKRKRPKASDTAICSWLLKSYKDERLEAVRRALHDARNPKRNSELAQLAEVVARSATGNRTRPVEEAAAVKAVSWVTENADMLWFELWGPRK